MNSLVPAVTSSQQPFKQHQQEDPDVIPNSGNKHYPHDCEPPNGSKERECEPSSAPPAGEER